MPSDIRLPTARWRIPLTYASLSQGPIQQTQAAPACLEGQGLPGQWMLEEMAWGWVPWGLVICEGPGAPVLAEEA